MSVAARRGRLVVAIATAAFALLALISAGQIYTLRRASGESVTVPIALAFGVASWIVWALVVPLILWLGRRFDFRRGRRLVSVSVHLAAMLVILVPSTLLLIATGMKLFSPDEAFPWSELPRQLYASSRLQMGVLIYAAILGLGRGVEAWRRLGEREVQAGRLAAQATAARLEALASRLQPHFLFNALHTVGALIDEDPARARQLLADLGDLLRDVLAEPGAVEVPLEEELRLLDRYLSVEQTRFADRLRLQIDPPGRFGLVPVPRLLLQPLVENALRHGIAPRAVGGTVRLGFGAEADQLVITVANDGAALGSPVREGVGLGTTRERLSTRYGDRASLTLSSADGWVLATVRLPIQAVT